jgi:hypothetical protein
MNILLNMCMCGLRTCVLPGYEYSNSGTALATKVCTAEIQSGHQRKIKKQITLTGALRPEQHVGRKAYTRLQAMHASACRAQACLQRDILVYQNIKKIFKCQIGKKNFFSVNIIFLSSVKYALLSV